MPSPSTNSGSTAGGDPDTEVLVTTGATEGIAAAMLASSIGRRGDGLRAVLRLLRGVIAMAGAVRRTITVRPPEFVLDDESSADGHARTRLILLNTPHNPIGKVFSRGELESVAASPSSTT